VAIFPLVNGQVYSPSYC